MGSLISLFIRISNVIIKIILFILLILKNVLLKFIQLWLDMVFKSIKFKVFKYNNYIFFKYNTTILPFTPMSFDTPYILRWKHLYSYK